MKPKVAIILPTYNVIKFLPIMISSLYQSTQFDFKLIVVDGFSDDGTFEYLKTIKEGSNTDIDIYQIPKKGLVNAINYGIKKAGKLDVYLTQADVIHFKLYGRDWLMDFYDYSKKKDIGIVMGKGGGGVSGEAFIEGLKWAGTWNTYLTRKTINKIGYFDEQFSGGDDIDYCYRIGQAGLKGIVVDYWVQHHQFTERNDTHSSNHLKKMGKIFRKKYKL